MHNLVNLKELIPSLKLDIKYSKADNFTGIKLYNKPLAYLLSDAVKDLLKVQTELEKYGLGLVVWDAYRPFSVTQVMWDCSSEKNSDYVADPKNGSVHNRGCAIDVTLHELGSKNYLEMPTAFDDFSTKAASTYKNCSDVQAKNRDLLINVMLKFNFTVDKFEWWHFNWNRWSHYPVLDVRIDEL